MLLFLLWCDDSLSNKYDVRRMATSVTIDDENLVNFSHCMETDRKTTNFSSHKFGKKLNHRQKGRENKNKNW